MEWPAPMATSVHPGAMMTAFTAENARSTQSGCTAKCADSSHLLRSIIAGNGTVVRCCPIAEIDHYLVDVTPSPAFGWVIAFDDRVPRLVEVLRGMTVRRVVAATDMAAGPAQAQMQ